MRRSILIPGLALALTAAACTRSDSAPTSAPAAVPTTEALTLPEQSFAGSQPAPEFPAGLDWLNSGGNALTLAQLQGKVVLLDFWTYGCINCIHIIPDLKRLEAEYPDELVVIGVHSAKFANESATDNIRQVILRYGLEHPVVNDRDFETWTQWGATAWPTTAVVDPAGNVVGVRSGEGVYDAVEPVIASLVQEFDFHGTLDRTPITLGLESDGLPATILSFPGKVLVDSDQTTIYIADTNHHRIVQATLPNGEVTAVYGSGTAGYMDGVSLESQFDSPQGMSLAADGNTLYVADTNNHVVRNIDLLTGEVTTVLGTGRQGRYPPIGGLAPDVGIRSPWDVEVEGSVLYIAMAGSHQIWSLDLETGLAAPFSGNGGENTIDGNADVAQLAQPSGLTLDGMGNLFFADSESSSIRVSATLDGRVDTVVGAERGLFEFGDVDGQGTEVRLQHPLGVAWAGDRLFIADTYNSKIKVIDPETREAMSFAGGEAGFQDGAQPMFYEPGGLDISGNTLYVADTNNHSIRLVDIETGDTETLILKGIEAFEPQDEYRGKVVELDAIEASAGEVTVVLDITLPPGHKVNEDAPSSIEWISAGDAVAAAPAAMDLTGTKLPVTFSATLAEGSGHLTADLTLVWCRNDAEGVCFIERARIGAPLETGSTGGSEVVIPYEITLPDLTG